MSICPICNIQYNRDNRKAFILECGHSACSQCINFYKDAGKDLECGECCNKTKSLNIENKALYPTTDNQSNKKTSGVQKDEFEINIRKRNTQDKFPILVKKNMTVKELKNKIKAEQGIAPESYTLAFRKPLTDEDKTLEYYLIKQLVTVTMVSDFEGGI